MLWQSSHNGVCRAYGMIIYFPDKNKMSSVLDAELIIGGENI